MRVKMSRGMGITLGVWLLGGAVAVATGRYTLGRLREAMAVFTPVAAAVLLHEGGHVLAACLLGVRLGGFRLDLFGARLGLCGTLSYRREWLVAAAGPGVNLLTAALLLLPVTDEGGGACAAYLSGGSGGAVLALASLGLAAVNLLPVRSLDGGRMLRCFLAPLCGERVADVAVSLGTALCLGGLWCFSVYALLRVGEMLGLFAFSLCLLGRMVGGERWGVVG